MSHQQSKWTNLHKLAIQEDFQIDSFESSINEINQQSVFGSSVLHFAIAGGNIETIGYILRHSPNMINCRNYMGETPLHWACKESSIKVISYLINGGALFLPDNEGNTPLHWAAEFDRVDTLKLLLTHYEISSDYKNDRGETPLQIAKLNGSTGCEKFLSKKVDAFEKFRSLFGK